MLKYSILLMKAYITTFMKQLLFFLFFTSFLFSATLESKYKLHHLDINASLIYPDIQNDFRIYSFEKNKFRKSISSKQLVQVFKSHNIVLLDKSRGIVNFERTSNIDFSDIKEEVKKYYLSYYPNMNIEDISLRSNSSFRHLPSIYTLIFKHNAYLHNSSSLKLVSQESKEQLFLNYTITASLKVFKASHNINRGKILSYIDLTYKEETFSRFMGTPLKSINERQVRLRKRLPKGKTIYEHDVEPLPSVLKNKNVYVRFNNGNVHLEFQAKSLQDAQIGETISVQKKDKTRLKAKVIGRNLVEIE